MSLFDAVVFEPFSVNEPILDSLLLEPDAIEVWIAYTTDGNKGTGTQWDPYDGSSQTLLDSLLNSFPPNTTVRLGAGPFQTQGYASGVNGGWQPKSGQRIAGAGIDDTILKLVNATSSSNPTSAIGAPSSNFLNGFEASDLTIDCNVGGQASSSVAWWGDLRVRCARLHSTHPGHQFRPRRHPRLKVTAIAIGTADPTTPQLYDCVIDSCVVEQPSPNNVRETTCLSIATKEDSNGLMAYHKACVIRDCSVNCEYSDRPIAINGIAPSGTTATVTTKFPHGRSSGQWVVVTGALESGQPSTHYNGSFQITVTDATHFTYTMGSSTTTVPTGDMFIGKAPSQRVAIKDLTLSAGVVTVETFTPHNRLPGQKVVINNVSGMTPSINDAFTINDLSPTPSPTKLRFNYGGSGTPGFSNGYIGVDFRGVEADGGIGAIIEGNRIYNCTFGCYHDGYPTRDLIVRNNHLRSVNTGIYQKMGGSSAGSGALWQVGRVIIENNIIELIVSIIDSSFGNWGWEAPVGINLYDNVGSHGALYVFQQSVIRENSIRHVDDASDSSAVPLAVYLDSCLNAIVESNTIKLDAARPLRHYVAGTVKYFNNQTPSGKLIQGASYTKAGSYGVPVYLPDTLNKDMNELTIDAEMGLLLSKAG